MLYRQRQKHLPIRIVMLERANKCYSLINYSQIDEYYSQNSQPIGGLVILARQFTADWKRFHENSADFDNIDRIFLAQW